MKACPDQPARADIALAPKGRQLIARGVSPWNRAAQWPQSQRGGSEGVTVAPSGLRPGGPRFQGLGPLAINYRPFGAGRSRLSLLLATCFFLAFSPRVPAADWPQFMGPDRNGVSTEKGLAQS